MTSHSPSPSPSFLVSILLSTGSNKCQDEFVLHHTIVINDKGLKCVVVVEKSRAAFMPTGM